MPPSPHPTPPLARLLFLEAELEQQRRECEALRTALEEQTARRKLAERCFEALAETVPHIIWAAQPDGALDYFSQRSLHYVGRTHDELKDWSWQQVLHPDDVPIAVERWTHSLQTGSAYETEFRLKRASDGEYRWHLVRALPEQDSSGQIVRWFGSCTDVHDQKTAEAALLTAHRELEARVLARTRELARANQRLQSELAQREILQMARRKAEDERDTLFDLSRDMFCIGTLDGYFTQLNPAWTKTLGHSLEDLLELPFEEFVHPEDREATRRSMVNLDATESVASFENRFRAKDGSWHWLSWSAFSDPQQRLVYAVVRDVTGQKLVEEELRQIQKLDSIGRLAAGIAHDFNNLLTVQQACLSLVLGDLRLPSHFGEPLNQVAQAADRAASLTRQLLLFSRKQLLQMRPLRLEDVVHNVVQMLGRILGEDIELKLLKPEGPLRIHADPGMIEQVLMNLAVNSRDAMPQGGELLVGLDSMVRESADGASKRFARLTVADNGTGISQGIREQIFEPFFTTKEVGHGTGLGLSTVYGIVQQHGGWIDFESSEGTGTTFHVFLPLLEDGAAPPSGDEVVRGPLLGTATILLVEDEAPLRHVVTMILEDLGYRVISAAHGHAALAAWQEHRGSIDLLLTDMIMPGGLSGLEVAERLRQEDAALRVILTSGYSEDLLTARAQHATAFLQKPFLPSALADLVHHVLTHEGRDEAAEPESERPESRF